MCLGVGLCMNMTVPNGGAGPQHESRRAAVFVDEDCGDSRSDVDDLMTRDCLYDESKIRRSQPTPTFSQPAASTDCCLLYTSDAADE